ncbi:MAG: DUF5666 domain-containing protein [Gammaproteobacteria bacterium]|nr:DUF5666 domain-containing protein [Gammaproteobacteria bacterium]
MKILSVFLTTLFLMVLAACGGSGSDAPPGNNAPPPVGGIGRTGVAFGPISTFGSIVVNGVRYDTSSATFTVDDSPGSESDLRVGHVVLVKGEIDDNLTTGTAQEVSFNENVKGPIQSIDLAMNRLVVLGQTVIISPETSFDDNIQPASLAGLIVGDIVEVSGQTTSDGSVVATRIEKKPVGTSFEVHGVVSNLDAANSRFSINALAVDYSAAVLDNFPGGQISNGDFVEAKGTALDGSGALVASRVEFEGGVITGANGDYVEIEGFITRFVSAQDFDVSGVSVITNGSTVFEGGVAADLGLNVKVEVDGTLNSSGIIIAEKVDIRRAKAVRVTALVDSVNAAGNSLVMLGITFNVDALTRLEDKSSADVDPLTIGDLNAGDYLEIRGSELPAGSGQIAAAILEREDIDSRTILQGFVETVSDPSFTILGVSITTNGSTAFRDTDDSIITAAEFFNRVSAGSLVKASGTETSSMAITADEVEFELEF